MPYLPDPNPRLDPTILLPELDLQVDSLYASSRASEWKLARAQFAAALTRSIEKRFAHGVPSRAELVEYLATLHAEDLALASACIEGSEAAWEYFVETYRGYLRAAAGSLTKGSRSGTDAQELADSLFAELYGLIDGKRGEASLFRYFHGRSSLKTWLRTILAQRHVDRLRQSRRWESLEREDGMEEKALSAQGVVQPPADPYRRRYLRRFILALGSCLDALKPIDRKRLELYYARDKTLAEIGHLLCEHESSASRNLERTRRELRSKVEECLCSGRQAGHPSRPLPPMSAAEIALCFQYAAEDAPIDFRQIFPEKPPGRSTTEGGASS